MQSDLAEAYPYVRSQALITTRVISGPKSGSLRRISEEGALLCYLRLSRGDEAQPNSIAGGAWALRSIQPGGLCRVRPSATPLALIFQVHQRSRGCVGALRTTTQPCSGWHRCRPRTAAAADVRSPPLRANDVIGSPLALPAHRQAPPLPNG